MAKIKVIKSGKESAKPSELLPVDGGHGRSGAAEVENAKHLAFSRRKALRLPELVRRPAVAHASTAASPAASAEELTMCQPRDNRECTSQAVPRRALHGSWSCASSAAVLAADRDRHSQIPDPVMLTIGYPHVTGRGSAARYAAGCATHKSRRPGTCKSRRTASARLAESWTESPDGLTWTIQASAQRLFHEEARRFERCENIS